MLLIKHYKVKKSLQRRSFSISIKFLNSLKRLDSLMLPSMNQHIKIFFILIIPCQSIWK